MVATLAAAPASAARRAVMATFIRQRFVPDTGSDAVVLWADASVDPNRSIGGYAVVRVAGGGQAQRIEAQHSVLETRSTGELERRAALLGLQIAYVIADEERQRVKVCSDSKSVVGKLTVRKQWQRWVRLVYRPRHLNAAHNAARAAVAAAVLEGGGGQLRDLGRMVQS